MRQHIRQRLFRLLCLSLLVQMMNQALEVKTVSVNTLILAS